MRIFEVIFYQIKEMKSAIKPAANKDFIRRRRKGGGKSTEKAWGFA